MIHYKRRKTKFFINTELFFLKQSLRLFNLNFKLKNNNSVISVCSELDKVLFWKTCRCLQKEGASTRVYSKALIKLLCGKIFSFLRKATPGKNKFKLIFKFTGLIRFRLLIINFFLKKKIHILKIVDLNLFPHNGPRQSKKRRLKKKRRRKLYWFAEARCPNFKVSRKKKKIQHYKVKFLAINWFYIYDFLLKIHQSQFFFFSSLNFYKLQFDTLALLRSPHNFGAHRRLYSYIVNCVSFKLLSITSSVIRSFFLVCFIYLKNFLYLGTKKVESLYVSFKF